MRFLMVNCKDPQVLISLIVSILVTIGFLHNFQLFESWYNLPLITVILIDTYWLYTLSIRITIDDAGISSRSIFTSKFLSWQDIVCTNVFESHESGFTKVNSVNNDGFGIRNLKYIFVSKSRDFETARWNDKNTIRFQYRADVWDYLIRYLNKQNTDPVSSD